MLFHYLKICYIIRSVTYCIFGFLSTGISKVDSRASYIYLRFMLRQGSHQYAWEHLV